MRTATVATRYGVITIGASDEYILPALHHARCWESHVIERGRAIVTARPGAVIVDAGAYVGTHTLAWAPLAAQTLAFEPQSQIFELLRRNVAANGLCEKVRLHRTALGHLDDVLVRMNRTFPDGSAAGQSVLTAYEDDASGCFNYGGLSLGAHGEAVAMQTIDGLGLAACTMIKADVQGAEPLLFWGARDTLRRCRPHVFFEKDARLRITDDMRASMPIPEVVAAFDVEEFCLRELGYVAVERLSVNDYLLVPES